MVIQPQLFPENQYLVILCWGHHCSPRRILKISPEPREMGVSAGIWHQAEVASSSSLPIPDSSSSMGQKP